MILLETTNVPAAALPLQGFRDHLRLGTGFGEDAMQDGLLEGFLRAAMAAVEGRTGKILLTRDFALTRDDWTGQDRIVLPVAPVSTIASVEVLDPSAVPSVVPAAMWRLSPDLHRPLIVAPGGALPTVPHGGSVRVAFTAGFGPAWSDLPADLGQAVMMLATHYHEHRDETGLGPGCTPFGVSALIERWRNLRLFGRRDER